MDTPNKSRPLNGYVVAFPHPPQRHGGPGTFQRILEKYLEEAGADVKYADQCAKPDVILVVGGTRRVYWLLASKLRGAKVVHRLDGLLWDRNVPAASRIEILRRFAINHLMALIRNHLADVVVYQSAFIERWWRNWSGATSARETIIHNGTSPQSFVFPKPSRTAQGLNIVCVEGAVSHDPVTTAVLRRLNDDISKNNRTWQIEVYGQVSDQLREDLSTTHAITLKGPIPHEEIPKVLLSASVYLALERNPACPNAVIESLASGTPVVAFATGSLPELTPENYPGLANYSTDPWSAEVPDIQPLVSAIETIELRLGEYSGQCRDWAVERLKDSDMADKYIRVICDLLVG